MREFELGMTFDLAIVAVKSFAYLVRREDQQRTLRSIARHLRPGGLFALDLKNPSPEWLLEPPGSLRQDLVQYVPEMGATVTRTETAVSTDRAAQVRTIRSAYEVVDDDGSVMKRFVEWPYRYVYRFEAELLLEHAGFKVTELYGGYQREPFISDSPTMMFLARRI
jgi:SAM-dependent methyltransferase